MTPEVIEIELSTESQTDETKAEQLNIDGSNKMKIPCIADTGTFTKIKFFAISLLINCNIRSAFFSSYETNTFLCPKILYKPYIK